MANPDGRYNLTAPAVMSFPNLITPKAFGTKGRETGDPKFSANFLFAPDSEDLKAMKALCAKIAKGRWPDRDLKTLQFPFTSGDKLAEKSKAKGKDGEFNRGHVVVAARSKYRPTLSIILNGKVVDLDDATLTQHKGQFYPGVKVLAQFTFVTYDGVGANPDGVNAYLNMVLSTNKGARLAGGAPTAAEVFKDYIGHVTAEDPTAELMDDEIPF